LLKKLFAVSVEITFPPLMTVGVAVCSFSSAPTLRVERRNRAGKKRIEPERNFGIDIRHLPFRFLTPFYSLSKTIKCKKKFIEIILELGGIWSFFLIFIILDLFDYFFPHRRRAEACRQCEEVCMEAMEKFPSLAGMA
jgi:hypothetical protein